LESSKTSAQTFFIVKAYHAKHLIAQKHPNDIDERQKPDRLS
jgi:hypothetical protein